MIKKNSPIGFTLIEMIVSVSIILLISLISMPLLRNSQTKAKFDSQTDKVISALREAEILALSGQLVNNSLQGGYGVNLVNNTSEIVVFIDQDNSKRYGSGADKIASKIILEDGVTVSSTTMDVFWSFLSGEVYLNGVKPSSPIITITFKQTDSTKTATIKVNSITGQISKD